MTKVWFEYVIFQILQVAFIKLILFLWSGHLIHHCYFKYWKLRFFSWSYFFDFKAFIKLNGSFIKIIVTLWSSQIILGEMKIWKKEFVNFDFQSHENLQKSHDFCSIHTSILCSHRKKSWNFAWLDFCHLEIYHEKVMNKFNNFD